MRKGSVIPVVMVLILTTASFAGSKKTCHPRRPASELQKVHWKIFGLEAKVSGDPEVKQARKEHYRIIEAQMAKTAPQYAAIQDQIKELRTQIKKLQAQVRKLRKKAVETPEGQASYKKLRSLIQEKAGAKFPQYESLLKRREELRALRDAKKAEKCKD